MLDTDFCLEALEGALSKATPEIFNTDQGVQFTSHRFTDMLETRGIRISMDGKGRAFDNIMVERLWRSVKYEDIYPRGYELLPEARQGLERYFPFYRGIYPSHSKNWNFSKSASFRFNGAPSPMYEHGLLRTIESESADFEKFQFLKHDGYIEWV